MLRESKVLKVQAKKSHPLKNLKKIRARPSHKRSPNQRKEVVLNQIQEVRPRTASQKLEKI